MDSFRHDMLGKNTPFLSKLANKGVSGALQPPLSFCLHPTWFAGLNPASSGKAFLNVYSPQITPYKRLKLISFLKAKRLNGLFRKFSYNYFPQTPYGGAPNIPESFLQYFDRDENIPPWHKKYLYQKTLFDAFRQHGLNWLFIGSPGSDQRTFSIVENIKRTNPKKHSFIWLHFAELDWVCHKFGPQSIQSQKILRDIDNAIRKVYHYLANRYSTIDILVFGDHGHVEINHVVNVQNLLNNVSSQIGQDYLYFLDSTIARFWFRTDRARNEISSVLSGVTCMECLPTNTFGIKRFNENSKQGELIWIVKEGYIISPNFWQGNKKVKGMHGYCSNVKNNYSCFVLSGPNIPSSGYLSERFQLVDVFPTLLNMMQLPIPETNEGKTILPN